MSLFSKVVAFTVAIIWISSITGSKAVGQRIGMSPNIEWTYFLASNINLEEYERFEKAKNVCSIHQASLYCQSNIVYRCLFKP